MPGSWPGDDNETRIRYIMENLSDVASGTRVSAKKPSGPEPRRSVWTRPFRRLLVDVVPLQGPMAMRPAAALATLGHRHGFRSTGRSASRGSACGRRARIARNLHRPEGHGLVVAFKSNPTLYVTEMYAEARIAETEGPQYRHKTV